MGHQDQEEQRDRQSRYRGSSGEFQLSNTCKVEKKGGDEAVGARGCRFRAIGLKHPISRIQWISLLCLLTLSILAHKGVQQCAVQFSNYEGVEFPLINTVEPNGGVSRGGERGGSAGVFLCSVTSTTFPAAATDDCGEDKGDQVQR